MAIERARAKAREALSGPKKKPGDDDDDDGDLFGASASELLAKARRKACRACVKCAYVGAANNCPFCDALTGEAPRGARLHALTQRFLMGTDPPPPLGSVAAWANEWGGDRDAIPDSPDSTPADDKGGGGSSSGGDGKLKAWQRPGYYRKVPGLLGGGGKVRRDGSRSWLVALGGRDSKRRVLASAELLAPDATSWQVMAPLKHARAQAAAAVTAPPQPSPADAVAAAAAAAAAVAAAPSSVKGKAYKGGAGGEAKDASVDLKGAGGGGRVYAMGGIDGFGVRLSSVGAGALRASNGCRC